MSSMETTNSDAVEPDIASYVLTNFHFILQNIFEYFPARTLNTFSRVCKIWKKTADEILKARSPFYWDYFTGDEVEEEGHEDPIFYMLTEILKSIKRMPIRPKTTIIFISQNFAISLEKFGTLGRPDFLSDLEWRSSESGNPMVTSQECSPPHNLREWFDYQMPFDCHSTAVVTEGVIGTTWDDCKSYENKHGCAFSYFCCSQNDKKMSLIPVDLDEQITSEFVDEWIGLSGYGFNLFNTNYQVKKIMYFKDINAIDVSSKLTEEYSQALVAGAVVESFEFPYLARETEACCIAFCGENVKVASVVMNNVTRSSQLEDYMKELKLHGLPEEKSIAFLFASVDTGFDPFEDVSDHFENFDIKLTGFRKSFPKTPIFGTFGSHQIGFSFPTPVPKSILCLVSFQ